MAAVVVEADIEVGTTPAIGAQTAMKEAEAAIDAETPIKTIAKSPISPTMAIPCHWCPVRECWKCTPMGMVS